MGWPKFLTPNLGTPSPMRTRHLVNGVALLVIIAVLSALSDSFLTAANGANVLRQIATILTVGGFFTLLMVAGGIDLSVGGVMAVSGVISVMVSNAGAPIPVAFTAAILVGALVGLVNGFIVSVLGVNTVIATLATMYLTRGSALLITEGKVIGAQDPDYAGLGNATIGSGFGPLPPIPVVVIAMAVTLVIAALIERRSVLGRYAVLTGSNLRGARLSGVPVRSTQVALFVITGASAGWAGVMVSSRLGSAVSTVGAGFEFELLIATLIGGTSLLGGQGSIGGLILGALIVGNATSGMNILGVASFVQTVLLGVVLLGAVSLDSLVRARRERPVRGGNLLPEET